MTQSNQYGEMAQFPSPTSEATEPTTDPTIARHEGGLVQMIAFMFWFTMGLKGALAFLFFQEDASMATAVGAGLSVAMLFVLITLIPLAKRRSTWQEVSWPGALKILIAYIAWICLSNLWTHSDSPVQAAGYCGLLIIDLGVMMLASRMAPIELVARRSLQGVVMSGVVLALILLVMGAGTGDNRLGNNEFLHPNTIGGQLGVALLCGLYLSLIEKRPSQRFWQFSANVVLFVTLLATISKTAIAAFAVAAVVFLFRSKVSIGWKIGATGLAAIILTLMSSVLSSNLTAYVTDAQGGSAVDTISGRTLIWANTWEMIVQQPLLGYGLMSYRDFGPQIASVRLVHAHNELLQQWFSYGAVGLLLGVSIYAGLVRMMWRASRPGLAMPQYMLAEALLIYSVFRGLTEASTIGLIFPLPLLVILFYWLSQRRESTPLSRALVNPQVRG